MNEHREIWWASPTVELGRTVALDLPEPFRAVHGGKLEAIQVAYESWGELNAARDNAVLLVHPLASDPHAAGEFAGQPRGWWEPLIGPGRVIDTDTFFVVCPNLIGGCYGTTGPRFPSPEGLPFYNRFPLLTPLDMMRVQEQFVRALGIDRLHLVLGPSMGGMVAWEWAIEAPETAGRVAVIAAPLRTSPLQIGWNWLQRRGIELDISQNEVVAKWGQMVARGVGMLTYRSPVGLEEKFGRDWFKKPGATLAERGMFNVESWLRHHGRRIAKRFDPYTYLLFSRAMDLHDVRRDRGDLASAVGRITCPLMAMGISSDILYPPDDVHLGADLLRRMGGDARYREIRSPNGHDAFMLDTDQIAGFLREFLSEDRGEFTVLGARSVRPVRVAVLGAGRVAAAFLRLLDQRRDQTLETHGLDLQVTTVAEIDPEKRLDPVFEAVEISRDPIELTTRGAFDVLVDLTRGPGSAERVRKVLARGIPVVTPNKALLKKHGDALDRLAGEHGVRLAFHDSIAAGWPLIHALERPLSRGRVTGIRSMLSSACNLILEHMERGATLEEGLAEAKARELTEPDPDLDLSGWDSAQKLAILLARTLRRRYAAADMEVLGIRHLDPGLVRRAPEQGFRIKLVGLAQETGDAPRGGAFPAAVPVESHLGLVRGSHNIVVLRLSDGGEMVYLGSGAGELPVATAVLNDVLGLFNPRHSWTGRFPVARRPLAPPRFDRWISPEGAFLTEPTPGGVPVLDEKPI